MDQTLPPAITAPSVVSSKPKFELKKLSNRHKQAAALLAQGVKREVIAAAIQCTPEYVTMLAGQALFQEYLEEMQKVADLRLRALFEKSVDVVADVLNTGTPDEKLRAARLQMEAAERLGKNQKEYTVHHKHSLVGILSSLPPLEAVPNWDVRKEKVVSEQ